MERKLRALGKRMPNGWWQVVRFEDGATLYWPPMRPEYNRHPQRPK